MAVAGKALGAFFSEFQNGILKPGAGWHTSSTQENVSETRSRINTGPIKRSKYLPGVAGANRARYSIRLHFSLGRACLISPTF